MARKAPTKRTLGAIFGKAPSLLKKAAQKKGQTAATPREKLSSKVALFGGSKKRK